MRWLAVALLLCSCNYNVYSPPARLVPLESAATVGRNGTRVQAQGVLGAGEQDGANTGGEVLVRHGLADAVEGTVSASYLHVGGDSAAGTDPGVYMMRLGAKANLGTRHLAAAAGVGGGASAGGAYLAADAALFAAYENCYLVPFGQAHILVSAPLDAKTVDVTKSGDMDQRLSTPEATSGIGLGFGLKLPFGADPCHPSVNALLGVDLTVLDDNRKSDLFATAALGIEIAL